MNMELLGKLAKIKLMIFDVDGVLTDGKLNYGQDGEIMKSFNVLDGHGIKLLKHANVETAIVSARNTPIVLKRATDLDIDHVIQGAGDKRAALGNPAGKNRVRSRTMRLHWRRYHRFADIDPRGSGFHRAERSCRSPVARRSHHAPCCWRRCRFAKSVT